LARLSGLFYKVRNFINMSALCMLYYSLIYSRLQYGIIIWITANKTRLNSFKLCQNKILRIMLSRNIYMPVSKLHKTLNLLNLEAFIT